jgi:GAF domain-containing protein
VAATGETINLPDAYDDPRFNREFDARTGKRTRSLLTVAMKGTDGRVIGVFQLMNKRTGAFTRDDIALLSWLKEAALVAIQNASQDAQAAEEPPTIRTAADP